MTKEQFDNQKWLKNMPVKESTGDPRLTYYVQGVNHKKRTVLISLGENSQWGTRWERAINIEPVHPEPTALDLIAAEREKQISKGYTVEHDAAYAEETGVNFATIAIALLSFTETPERWDSKYWDKLCELPYKDRIRIAATWMARELERLLFIQNKEVTK